MNIQSTSLQLMDENLLYANSSFPTIWDSNTTPLTRYHLMAVIESFKLAGNLVKLFWLNVAQFLRCSNSVWRKLVPKLVVINFTVLCKNFMQRLPLTAWNCGYMVRVFSWGAMVAWKISTTCIKYRNSAPCGKRSGT